MSYDLSIRYDEDFSQSAELGSFESWILSDPRVRRNGDSSFLLESTENNLWIEVDLEVAPEEDELRFDCIRIHIPYAKFTDETETECLCFAHRIGKHLGWVVVDEQMEGETRY